MSGIATTVINKSHATIAVGSNAQFQIVGSDDLVNVGGSSTVSVNGAGDTISATGVNDSFTVGGNGQNAADAADFYITLASTATAGSAVALLSGARADVKGNHASVTLAAHDTLGVSGAADIVTTTGADDLVSIGGNGETATAANVDSVRVGSGGGLIVALANSSLTVSGAKEVITLNANDAVSATGSGYDVNVLGADDVLSIGSNGQNASGADDNFVQFNVAGMLRMQANSHADAYGDDITAALAANDTLGIFGSGETVTGVGTGDHVSIGGNAQTPTVSDVDTITLGAGGTVFETHDSHINVNGSNLTITTSLNDWLKLNLSTAGGGDTVYMEAPNSTVELGGNGFNGAKGVDTVYFQGASGSGSVHAHYQSDVIAIGNSIAVTVGEAGASGATGYGRATFVGSAETAVAVGPDDYVTMGGNGQNAGLAAQDYIYGSVGQSVIYANSNVIFYQYNTDPNATPSSIKLLGSDTINVVGAGLNIAAYGGNDFVTIDGTGSFPTLPLDVVKFVTSNGAGKADTLASGTLHALRLNNIEMSGVNSTLILEDNNVVTVIGTGNAIDYVANSYGSNVVTIQGTATVNETTFTSNTYNVTKGSSAVINSAGFATVNLLGGATATLTGLFYTAYMGLIDTSSTGAAYLGSKLTVGGTGETIPTAATLSGLEAVAMGSLDSVNIVAKSALTLMANTLDPVELNTARATAKLEGNDFVNLDPGYYALSIGSAKTGDDYIEGYSTSSDTLNLGSAFSSASALLSATTYASGNAIIHIDNAGDTVTLQGVTQSAFTVAVSSGAIKY